MIDLLCTSFQTPLKSISRFPRVVLQPRESPPFSSLKDSSEFFSQPGNSFQMRAEWLPGGFIS